MDPYNSAVMMFFKLSEDLIECVCDFDKSALRFKCFLLNQSVSC